MIIEKRSTNPGIKFSIFDENASLKVTLKNPNRFREAVIYEHLSHLSPARIKSFIYSQEAKAMVEAGTITYDTLERLQKKSDEKDKTIRTAVCDVAMGNDDELWNQLVAARAEERRIMNALLAKYQKEVDPLALNAREEIIKSCIPAEYQE